MFIQPHWEKSVFLAFCFCFHQHLTKHDLGKCTSGPKNWPSWLLVAWRGPQEEPYHVGARNDIHVGRNVLETTQLCLIEPPQVKHIQTNPTRSLNSTLSSLTIIELKILPSDPETSTETSSFHICFSTTQHSLVHIELPHTHSSSLLPALSLSLTRIYLQHGR